MKYVLLAVLAASSARAQDAEVEYRALIDEAVEEFNAERFPEARAFFRRAHAIVPNARALRGIGLASIEMRDYAEAYRALRAALAETRRPLTDAQRREATLELSRARALVGIYRIALTPADAYLELDGRRIEPEPDGTLILGLGTYQITGRARGYHDMRRGIEVVGGEETELSMELVQIAEDEIVAPEAIPRAHPDPPPEPPPPRPRRPAARPFDPGPLAFGLTGGVLGGSALVTGLAWVLHQEEQLSLCAESPTCRNEGAVRASRDASVATTVVLSLLGAAAIGVAIALFVTGNAPSQTAWLCDAAGCTLSF